MVQFEGREVPVLIDLGTRGMSLCVDGNGQVLVKVAYRSSYTEEQIQNFIDRHKRYLRNQLACYADVRLPDFTDGGTVLLLGKAYTVVRAENIHTFEIRGDRLMVPEGFWYLHSSSFFPNLLRPYVKDLTERYAEKYGLKCSGVDIFFWHSAWGTNFSADNSIKYNVALVFLPEDCIRYLVVHELCHSLHPNHSRAFWAEVERIYPQYKEAEARVKKYNIEWLYERAKLDKGDF